MDGQGSPIVLGQSAIVEVFGRCVGLRSAGKGCAAEVREREVV